MEELMMVNKKEGKVEMEEEMKVNKKEGEEVKVEMEELMMVNKKEGKVEMEELMKVNKKEGEGGNGRGDQATVHRPVRLSQPLMPLSLRRLIGPHAATRPTHSKVAGMKSLRASPVLKLCCNLKQCVVSGC
ncbi:hypothetical protein Pcinc_032870 [Petrolisthes cinctipes]|uniref:Uncharacterized protein n=1 Tax=Petrolisthes cinctipes TaxID=88211 RepID=A0AAE1K2C8_PETCI|nr:hypothetical protein Pcinc_032870 [Petrolisthes cinctipes]